MAPLKNDRFVYLAQELSDDEDEEEEDGEDVFSVECIQFLGQVREALDGQQFNEFLLLALDILAGNPVPDRIILNIIPFFNDHPHLGIAFSAFLPPGFSIEEHEDGLVYRSPTGPPRVFNRNGEVRERAD